MVFLSNNDCYKFLAYILGSCDSSEFHSWLPFLRAICVCISPFSSCLQFRGAISRLRWQIEKQLKKEPSTKTPNALLCVSILVKNLSCPCNQSFSKLILGRILNGVQQAYKDHIIISQCFSIIDGLDSATVCHSGHYFCSTFLHNDTLKAITSFILIGDSNFTRLTDINNCKVYSRSGAKLDFVKDQITASSIPRDTPSIIIFNIGINLRFTRPESCYMFKNDISDLVLHTKNISPLATLIHIEVPLESSPAPSTDIINMFNLAVKSSPGILQLSTTNTFKDSDFIGIHYSRQGSTKLVKFIKDFIQCFE